MTRLTLGFLLIFLQGTLLLRSQLPHLVAASQQTSPSMPSTEEINDLLSKASEYVTRYQATFKNAKPTLDKSPTTGFNGKSDELCAQAATLIAAVNKNGPTAYALVSLVGVLDDMSLNAARASSMALITGLRTSDPDQQKSATQDVQDLAQAEKNCYDISELILHATLRLIAAEEDLLHAISTHAKTEPMR